MLEKSTGEKRLSVSLFSEESSVSDSTKKSCSKGVALFGHPGAQVGTLGKSIASFTPQELVLGTVVGRGQFGVVREVINSPGRLKLLTQQGVSGGQEDASHCRRKRRKLAPRISAFSARVQSGSKAAFVVKQVNKVDFSTKIEKFSIAASELACEAQILSKLRHPHVIKLWGTSMPDMVSGERFLVLERLNETLEERIQQWRFNKEKNASTRRSFFQRNLPSSSPGHRPPAVKKPFNVALDLSRALKYIHSQNVIHRDLKPSNIGFDRSGEVKIFDFGLAKELSTATKASRGLFKLTGHTGSIKYMAPEVYHGKPYNQAADVYSFSIILWEIANLERAYTGYTDTADFVRDIFLLERRPELHEIESDSLKHLLYRSWSRKIRKRPTASDIEELLQMECLGVRFQTEQ